MAIRLEEITFDNYHECIDLEVFPEQKDNFYFKSTKPNMMSLAEAYVFGNNSQVLAIYSDETMVGAMFYNTSLDAEVNAWLIRFMIDKRYQKRGFGRKALEMLIERVRKEGAKTLNLCYEPYNKVGEKLYLSMGFRPTGETLGEQIVVRLDLSVSKI
jgi:diamine N-acetyltransferase